MVDEPFTIHSSHRYALWWMLLGLAFLPVGVWSAYEWAYGSHDAWRGLICIPFALFDFAMMAQKGSERITCSDGYLIRRNLFLRQAVYLPSLVQAARYLGHMGSYSAYPMLNLTDEARGRVIMSPYDYSRNDIEALMAIIGPYVFINRVDKNFMNLDFYANQPVAADVPKVSVWRSIRAALLLLLACLVFTLLVVAWAVLTKQASFR